jgi:CRP-like cAMP-binding protein
MKTEQLREVPLFATLSPLELNELASVMGQENYSANTTIFWMDEPGDKLYIIDEGEVSISFTNKSGKEETITTLGEGDFFGELSLLDGGPHTATARTVKPTSVLTFDRHSFYIFLEKHTGFTRTLLAVLVDRLRKTNYNLREGVPAELPPLRQPHRFQQLVDKAALFVTSSRFLAVAVVFLLLWICGQLFYHLQHHDTVNMVDTPPTFFFLGFVLTLSSFLLTILVLTSQRRQTTGFVPK